MNDADSTAELTADPTTTPAPPPEPAADAVPPRFAAEEQPKPVAEHPEPPADAGRPPEPAAEQGSHAPEPAAPAPARQGADAPRPPQPEPPRSPQAEAPRPPAPAADGPKADGESKFAGLGLDPKLVAVITGLGYEEPTPIQREAIPPLLAGKDLIGLAATGTGKTAAFALPLLQRLAQTGARGKPAALILVPTRELAMQVAEAVHKYGRAFNTRVIPVYGGAAFGQQARALERGVDVVVATPGRALDHLGRGTLKLSGVSIAVLDEADEMLDMGFAEDIDALLQETPKERQTMLFSATMPPRIEGIAKRHLSNPTTIRVAQNKVMPGTMPKVKQVAYVVPRPYKLAALARVLDVEAPPAALVFCRTRNEVDELTQTLAARGYRPESLHGGMSQEQRDRVMRLFRAGTADLLVATDVAARGLDVEHLTHVVNYHIPMETEQYVHRIGRVGRAGREGTAITLAEPREHRLLRNIERATGQKLEVGRVPTVADLKAKRMERVRASVREAITGGELDAYRAVVEALSDEHDVMDIALAAVKLVHQAETGDGEHEEQEIPVPPPPMERPRFQDRGPGRYDDRGPPRFRDDRRPYPPREDRGPYQPQGDRGGYQGQPDRGGYGGEERGGYGGPPDRGFQGQPDRGAYQGQGDRGGFQGQPDRGPTPFRPRPSTRPGSTRLFFSVGREDGVTPRDLVGAIANEAGLPGHDIGTIDMADRFALVEVPDDAADYVVDTMNGTRIRGTRVTVRRDRDEGQGGGGGFRGEGPGGGGFRGGEGGGFRPERPAFRPPNPGPPRGGRPSFRGPRPNRPNDYEE
jgi:ATP-dependent RNA helicase DeaD